MAVFDLVDHKYDGDNDEGSGDGQVSAENMENALKKLQEHKIPRHIAENAGGVEKVFGLIHMMQDAHKGTFDNRNNNELYAFTDDTRSEHLDRAEFADYLKKRGY